MEAYKFLDSEFQPNLNYIILETYIDPEIYFDATQQMKDKWIGNAFTREPPSEIWI